VQLSLSGTGSSRVNRNGTRPPVDHSVQPARVLVNAVSASVGGGATYAIEQIPALVHHPRLALTIIAVEPVASQLAKRAPSATVSLVPQCSSAIRIIWEQTALARRARRFDVVSGIGTFGLLLLRHADAAVAISNTLRTQWPKMSQILPRT
jgi:hypothetical protein